MIGGEVHVPSLFLHLFKNSREACLKSEETGAIKVVVERDADKVVTRSWITPAVSRKMLFQGYSSHS